MHDDFLCTPAFLHFVCVLPLLFGYARTHTRCHNACGSPPARLLHCYTGVTHPYPPPPRALLCLPFWLVCLYVHTRGLDHILRLPTWAVIVRTFTAAHLIPDYTYSAAAHTHTYLPPPRSHHLPAHRVRAPFASSTLLYLLLPVATITPLHYRGFTFPAHGRDCAPHIHYLPVCCLIPDGQLPPLLPHHRCGAVPDHTCNIWTDYLRSLFSLPILPQFACSLTDPLPTFYYYRTTTRALITWLTYDTASLSHHTRRAPLPSWFNPARCPPPPRTTHTYCHYLPHRPLPHAAVLLYPTAALDYTLLPLPAGVLRLPAGLPAHPLPASSPSCSHTLQRTFPLWFTTYWFTHVLLLRYILPASQPSH